MTEVNKTVRGISYMYSLYEYHRQSHHQQQEALAPAWQQKHLLTSVFRHITNSSSAA